MAPLSHQSGCAVWKVGCSGSSLHGLCEASLILTFRPCAVAVKNYRQRQKDSSKHTRCQSQVGAGYFYYIMGRLELHLAVILHDLEQWLWGVRGSVELLLFAEIVAWFSRSDAFLADTAVVCLTTLQSTKDTPAFEGKPWKQYIHMQQTDPAATSLVFKTICENHVTVFLVVSPHVCHSYQGCRGTLDSCWTGSSFDLLHPLDCAGLRVINFWVRTKTMPISCGLSCFRVSASQTTHFTKIELYRVWGKKLVFWSFWRTMGKVWASQVW